MASLPTRQELMELNLGEVWVTIMMFLLLPWADPEGEQGPPGIAKLLIFAMLKFSARPLLGI